MHLTGLFFSLAALSALAMASPLTATPLNMRGDSVDNLDKRVSSNHLAYLYPGYSAPRLT